MESRRGRPLAPPRKLEEVGINVSHAVPFISLAGVSIRLHGGALFERLDWEIENDQHWAVLGPNGSGKSALMKVLAGELPAVAGEISYHFLKHGEAAHDAIAYVAFEAQREVLGHESYYQDRWNAGLAEAAPTVSDILSERGIRHANPFVVDIPILHKNVKYRDGGFSTRRERIVREFGLKPLLNEKLIELSNGERRKGQNEKEKKCASYLHTFNYIPTMARHCARTHWPPLHRVLRSLCPAFRARDSVLRRRREGGIRRNCGRGAGTVAVRIGKILLCFADGENLRGVRSDYLIFRV